ncbi:hypothetical protein PIB30_063299 [Stylosanthes scabra]|uniref:Uncharacterized protein n=1 Tax=Stylosanthes scabra TaxID=79078 RepID=A0ABU6YK33_9FABA|nr:hypothetical protein [Stylosanthes scabra]
MEISGHSQAPDLHHNIFRYSRNRDDAHVSSGSKIQQAVKFIGHHTSTSSRITEAIRNINTPHLACDQARSGIFTFNWKNGLVHFFSFKHRS